MLDNLEIIIKWLQGSERPTSCWLHFQVVLLKPANCILKSFAAICTKVGCNRIQAPRTLSKSWKSSWHFDEYLTDVNQDGGKRTEVRGNCDLAKYDRSSPPNLFAAIATVFLFRAHLPDDHPSHPAVENFHDLENNNILSCK